MNAREGVDFGIAGVWVKLADIDRVNDIAPVGTGEASLRDDVSQSARHVTGWLHGSPTRRSLTFRVAFLEEELKDTVGDDES